LVVPSKAKSITCYRPTAFTDRQKLEDSQRAGLPVERLLEIGRNQQQWFSLKNL